MNRYYYIDWLRIFAVFLLIPFHSALIFVLNSGSIMYIKDNINSPYLDHAAGFVHQFHMPLLFVLAGAATWFSLDFRSRKEYLGERINRLFMPAIFGLFILIPPMTHITLKSKGINISYLEHYKLFLKINVKDLTGISGNFTPGHLWFVLFLFIFSLIGLSFFHYLKKPKNKKIVKSIAQLFQRKYTIFMMAIPIIIASSLDILGDKNPIVYFIFFILGGIFVSEEVYKNVAKRDLLVYLSIGLVFEIIRQICYPGNPWTLSWIMYGIIQVFNRWIWVLFFIGLFYRFFNKNNRILRYLSKIAYPFYILHLPINTLVGFWLIKYNLPIAYKYLLIVIITIIITCLLSEIISHIVYLRFFIGFKMKKEKHKYSNNLSKSR